MAAMLFILVMLFGVETVRTSSLVSSLDNLTSEGLPEPFSRSSELPGRHTRQVTSDVVPDVSMIYNVKDSYPGDVELYCVTGDHQMTLEVYRVPDYSVSPGYSRPYQGRINFSWNGEAFMRAVGVACGDQRRPGHQVSAPLLVDDAKVVPEHLSVTVNKGEGLSVRFTNVGTNEVEWKKASTPSWTDVDLINNNQLIIPASQLDGSGFYRVRFRLPPGATTGNIQESGTFSLIMRECEAERYGPPYCLQWCPDCMYGGVCDAETGRCVCPPGLTGELCHTRCSQGKIGRDCTVDLPDARGKQICLPPPYGCRCSPGYKGPHCDQECGDGRWGEGCSRTCSCGHQGCDVLTGLCRGLTPACTGGGKGLPRLRKPPRITETGSMTTKVTFDQWRDGYDDGEIDASNDVLTYLIRFWLTKDGIYKAASHPVTPGNFITLTRLEPGSEYNLQVLVQVTNYEGKVCVANGFGRERVHTVPFRTSCPNKPPTPDRVTITDVKSTSFLVSWQDVSYKATCHIQYAVVVNKQQAFQDVAWYRPIGLEPYTEYDIVVWAQMEKTTYSNRGPTNRVKTLPLPPSAPLGDLVRHGRTWKATWWPAPGDKGDFYYSYRYKINYLACSSSQGSFTQWSDWSPTTTTNFGAPPYSKVDLRVKIKNEAGQRASDGINGGTPQDFPEVKVIDLVCYADSELCRVKIDRACRLINGPNLHADYHFYIVDQSLRSRFEGQSITSVTLRSFLYYTEIPLPDDLLPFVYYGLTVYPANRYGRNINDGVTKTVTFQTKPAKPGQVTNLQIHPAAKSLLVTWDLPTDDPPRGDLDNVRISWRKDSRWSYYNWQTAIASGKEYTIDDLEPDINYSVKVEAKNKDVLGYGPEVQKTVKTIQGKPTPVRNLTYHNTTTSKIIAVWEVPERPAGVIKYYNVSATQTKTNDLKKEDVIDDTQYEFTGLVAGEGYTVTVIACNEKQCSYEETREMWTQPNRPQLTSETEWITASPSTVTLGLPSLSLDSPPVVLWVVVTETVGDEEASPARAEEVKRQAVDQVNKTSSRLKRDLSDQTWIAAEIDLNGMGNEFVVGDNQTHGGFYNQPLEENGKYWVTVIAETRAGPHRVFSSSTPDLYTAVTPTRVASWVVPLLLLVMVCLTVAGYFLWRRNQEKSLLNDVTPPDNNEEPQDMSWNDNPIEDIPLRERHGPLVAVVECPSPNMGQPQFHGAPAGTVDSGSPRHHELVPVPEPDNPLQESESEYINLSRKIPRHQAEAYLTRALYSKEIEIEFSSVPAFMDLTCDDGQRDENRRKNRYRNNLPYDASRVRLPLEDDQPHTDYINANYIKSHSQQGAYIATQGPKDNREDTTHDFWRMIWCTGSHTVVMVANLVENAKVKVAQYWPDDGQNIVKAWMNIQHVSTEVKLDFIIRTFLIATENEQRLVKQYQYTAWPDHGVPQNPYGLAQMIKHLTQEPAQGPITVHCSAGIGRTGTILLVLHLLDQLNTSGFLDPHQALVDLRNGRPRLVENSIQYVFGHKLLLEVLSDIKTSFTCSAFLSEVEGLRVPQPPSNTSLIHQQYQKIKSFPKDLKFNFGHNPECAHLNRTSNILPADSRIVYLQNLTGSANGFYINAVRVNALEQTDAYIVAEHPQQHTLVDVWRMVYEKSVPVWVLIHELPQEEKEFPDVLPSGDQQMFDKLVVTVTGKTNYERFTEHYVEISCPSSRMQSGPHKCVVLMMKGWRHTSLLPNNPQLLLSVIERVQSLNIKNHSGLFSCCDGVSGCGVMMALFHILERINLLQEVDVYRSALTILYDRPQFLTHVEQYDFLHDAALEYIQAFNQYGNFN